MEIMDLCGRDYPNEIDKKDYLWDMSNTIDAAENRNTYKFGNNYNTREKPIIGNTNPNYVATTKYKYSTILVLWRKLSLKYLKCSESYLPILWHRMFLKFLIYQMFLR